MDVSSSYYPNCRMDSLLTVLLVEVFKTEIVMWYIYEPWSKLYVFKYQQSMTSLGNIGKRRNEIWTGTRSTNKQKSLKCDSHPASAHNFTYGGRPNAAFISVVLLAKLQ